jgi:hypothetical protein
MSDSDSNDSENEEIFGGERKQCDLQTIIQEFFICTAKGNLKAVRKKSSELGSLFKKHKEHQKKLSKYSNLSNCIEMAALLAIVNGQNVVAKFLVLSQLGIKYLLNCQSKPIGSDFYWEKDNNLFLILDEEDDIPAHASVLEIKYWNLSGCIEYFGISSLQFELQRFSKNKLPEIGLPVQRKDLNEMHKFGNPDLWHRNLVACVSDSKTKSLCYENLEGYVPLQDARCLKLEFPVKMLIARDIACGIFSLHCQNVGLGSISPAAILIKLPGPFQEFHSVKIGTRSVGEMFSDQVSDILEKSYPAGNSKFVMEWDVYAFALLAQNTLGIFQSNSPNTTVLNNLVRAALDFGKGGKCIRISHFLRELTLHILSLKHELSFISRQVRRLERRVENFGPDNVAGCSQSSSVSSSLAIDANQRILGVTYSAREDYLESVDASSEEFSSDPGDAGGTSILSPDYSTRDDYLVSPKVFEEKSSTDVDQSLKSFGLSSRPKDPFFFPQSIFGQESKFECYVYPDREEYF